jgi:hypothetical protein
MYLNVSLQIANKLGNKKKIHMAEEKSAEGSLVKVMNFRQPTVSSSLSAKKVISI